MSGAAGTGRTQAAPDVAGLVDRFYAACSARDIDVVRGLYAAQATHHDVAQTRRTCVANAFSVGLVGRPFGGRLPADRHPGRADGAVPHGRTEARPRGRSPARMPRIADRQLGRLLGCGYVSLVRCGPRADMAFAACGSYEVRLAHRRRVEEILRTLCEHTLGGPGCIAYEPHRDPVDPERYQSPAARRPQR